jgi:hypothetical protein
MFGTRAHSDGPQDPTRRQAFFTLAGAAASLALATAKGYAQMTPAWHYWTQSQRNQAIVNTAFNDLNKNVGVQCKPWVQNVVWAASGHQVWLPPTANGSLGWYWEFNAQYSSYVVGRSGGIRGVKVGEIIQMDWLRPRADHLNPHTAIVIGTYYDGMEWIDSNWNNDTKVIRHYMSFSTFESKVYLYSIYYVL